MTAPLSSLKVNVKVGNSEFDLEGKVIRVFFECGGKRTSVSPKKAKEKISECKLIEYHLVFFAPFVFNFDHKLWSVKCKGFSLVSAEISKNVIDYIDRTSRLRLSYDVKGGTITVYGFRGDKESLKNSLEKFLNALVGLAINL